MTCYFALGKPPVGDDFWVFFQVPGVSSKSKFGQCPVAMARQFGVSAVSPRVKEFVFNTTCTPKCCGGWENQAGLLGHSVPGIDPQVLWCQFLTTKAQTSLWFMQFQEELFYGDGL